MEPNDLDQNENRLGPDRLDQWLDAALHEYGSAEPRMGLEGRVLANLAAERAQRSTRRWWVLGAAAALACVGIVVGLGGVHHRWAVRNVASNATSGELKADTANAQSGMKQAVIAGVKRPSRPHSHSAKAIEVAVEPRLGQFPSPRGLSEQEQLLLRYVTESPDEAVLVANEQAERRKELEKLMGDESSKIDSDQ